jgi:hypothetical protein
MNMNDFPIPQAALEQHTAVLGKTGSGKTSTSKLIVEHVVADGDRVCILDPIKSDWWGLTSSVDGKKAGLPFHILGGPRGHVPLHSSAGRAIGEIVASGALPLSVLDMADFEPGGLQRFFVDFAPTLLKKMRGVLYLVIEEAHEFAPKERSGIGAENLAIHWAKKLATAGRSKGIRLIVATQRTQSLHNALLGSCDTMIVHRLTAPADQEPVKKWLKANATKEVMEKVDGSLSSQKTGSAWICSGEAKVFEQVQFPRISTYDNSATPTKDSGVQQVKTAPVDQALLRSIIGEAVKESEENDPKALKAEIAALKRQFAMKVPQPSTPDPKAIEEAELRGIPAGRRIGFHEGWEACAASARVVFDEMPPLLELPDLKVLKTVPRAGPAKQSVPPSRPAQSMDDGTLTAPQRRVLESLGFWAGLGIEQPTRPQVGVAAGYSPSSGGFANLLGTLRTLGMIDYPASGRICLTADGGKHRPESDDRSALDRAMSILSGPQRKVLGAIIDHRKPIGRHDLGKATDYSATSGGFANLLGSLRSIDLIDYPTTGYVKAADWLFP